jgi:hypothetical protein
MAPYGRPIAGVCPLVATQYRVNAVSGSDGFLRIDGSVGIKAVGCHHATGRRWRPQIAGTSFQRAIMSNLVERDLRVPGGSLLGPSRRIMAGPGLASTCATGQCSWRDTAGHHSSIIREADCVPASASRSSTESAHEARRGQPLAIRKVQEASGRPGNQGRCPGNRGR